jgi:hypothetical protein
MAGGFAMPRSFSERIFGISILAAAVLTAVFVVDRIVSVATTLAAPP